MPDEFRSFRSRLSHPRIRLTMVATTVSLLLAAMAMIAFATLRQEHHAGQTERITLAMTATAGAPHTTEGEIITHLTMTGGTAETIALGVYLTDMQGKNLPPGAGYEITAALTNLNNGVTTGTIPMQTIEKAATPTFETASLDLADSGWWRITVTIERPETAPVTSDFYVLLPDPNMTGSGWPADDVSDPAAERMLASAIGQMSEWDSLRWWEWLSGGNDSLVMAEFSVTTTDANGEPNAFQTRMLFTGGFERRSDGTPPAPPARNHFMQITIGDRAWSRNAEGRVSDTSPAQYLPIDRYPETYEGASQIRFGIREKVDGRTAQIITFRVSTEGMHSEAWYVFWIDVETGNVLKQVMIAPNHYMIRVYFDVNEPFVIKPPDGVEHRPATPMASPENP